MKSIFSTLLPRVTKDYQVAFTTDPEGRATFGIISSCGAILLLLQEAQGAQED
jgi:hypothetical protein